MDPKRKTVLIVDDDEGTRETLTAILRHDFRVLRAASGESALALMDKEDVDVMLLDVRLPGKIVSMTLEWRNAAEWRALCGEAGLTVTAAYAGFEGKALIDQTGDQVYVCTRT